MRAVHDVAGQCVEEGLSPIAGAGQTVSPEARSCPVGSPLWLSRREQRQGDPSRRSQWEKRTGWGGRVDAPSGRENRRPKAASAARASLFPCVPCLVGRLHSPLLPPSSVAVVEIAVSIISSSVTVHTHQTAASPLLLVLRFCHVVFSIASAAAVTPSGADSFILFLYSISLH